MRPIEEVLNEHTPSIMAISGVVGTGIGCSGASFYIQVFVVKDSAEVRGQLPESIEGWVVSIIETGEVRALS